MHFTTLFVLKNKKLENITKEEIEKLFSERFCYNCGETTPKYQMWCDWFSIGGRWCDPLKAKKGIHCQRGWSNDNAPIVEGEYAIVEINDLTEPLPTDRIYAIATKSRIYTQEENWQSGSIVDKDKFHQLVEDINNKKFNGVIAFIDCHD